MLPVRTTTSETEGDGGPGSAPFAALGAISDRAPPRTELTIGLPDRLVKPISLPARAVAVITEHGPEGIIQLIQSVLTAANKVDDAGLAAQPKAESRRSNKWP